VAGGQSLVPLMKLRFASPRALVDPNRLGRLDFLGEEDGMMVSANASERAVSEGTTYVFCGSGCRARFEADPVRYLALGKT
jgi:YHS domain-containing protein